MSMSMARPRRELSPISSPAPLLHINRLQRLKAHSILGHRVGNRLAIKQERIIVQVLDIITNLMVVDIVGNTSFTAEELGFLLRLELLGAGEETTGGDAVFDEGGVVGAAAEFGGYVGGAFGLVELLEVGFEDVGAGGAGEVEGVAVAIVDAVDVVGAGDLVGSKLAWRSEIGGK